MFLSSFLLAWLPLDADRHAWMFVPVHRAKDLESGDLNGKSDPYVSCYVTRDSKKLHEFKTEPILNTLAPEWTSNNKWEFEVMEGDTAVVEIYDHDVVTSDEYLYGALSTSVDTVPRFDSHMSCRGLVTLSSRKLWEFEEKWFKIELYDEKDGLSLQGTDPAICNCLRSRLTGCMAWYRVQARSR
jgi:C2 domain